MTNRGSRGELPAWFVIKKSSWPMHSLRHVGHRWGAVYEAHYVAFPPGSRRSQNNSLYLVSVHAERGHALRISRRTRRLNGCERVQAGQNRATIIQRNEEGKRIEEPTTKEVPPTDAITTLKQTLISETNTKSLPRLCPRAREGKPCEDRVNA